GSAAYDFSKVPLDKLADELGQAGKTDEAVSLLLENLEHFPEDTWGLLILGGIHKGRGEKEKAVATFRKVLEINPNSRWARGELAELEASDRNDE
ncbi:MAG TPA: tetratricopeptide repeat protein, partial [bacterium]|nr:tetratricopeptide repeat protein [bacterium]